MAVDLYAIVRCDVCGKEIAFEQKSSERLPQDKYTHGLQYSKARRAAAHQGWSCDTKLDRDYCPEHGKGDGHV